MHTSLLMYGIVARFLVLWTSIASWRKKNTSI